MIFDKGAKSNSMEVGEPFQQMLLDQLNTDRQKYEPQPKPHYVILIQKLTQNGSWTEI